MKFKIQAGKNKTRKQIFKILINVRNFPIIILKHRRKNKRALIVVSHHGVELMLNCCHYFFSYFFEVLIFSQWTAKKRTKFACKSIIYETNTPTNVAWFTSTEKKRNISIFFVGRVQREEVSQSFIFFFFVNFKHMCLTAGTGVAKEKSLPIVNYGNYKKLEKHKKINTPAEKKN